jgi:hypothetical protein
VVASALLAVCSPEQTTPVMLAVMALTAVDTDDTATHTELLLIWKLFPSTVAPTERLVRWIALDDGAGSQSARVAALLDVVTARWTGKVAAVAASKEVNGALQRIFVLLTAQEPPSSGGMASLRLLIERLPATCEETICGFVADNTAAIPDGSLVALLKLMLAWPASPAWARCVLAVIAGLGAAKPPRMSVLVAAAVGGAGRLLPQLLSAGDDENARAACAVITRLLLGFQHSHRLFHSLLPALHQLLAHRLAVVRAGAAQSKRVVSDTVARLLGDLSRALMHHFTGFPELYMPLMETLDLLGLAVWGAAAVDRSPPLMLAAAPSSGVNQDDVGRRALDQRYE